MSQINRMNNYFGGGFEPDPERRRDEFAACEPFTYNISFPQTPDHVYQRVKLADGRLIVRLEFVFEDVDLLETEDC